MIGYDVFYINGNGVVYVLVNVWIVGRVVLFVLGLEIMDDEMMWCFGLVLMWIGVSVFLFVIGWRL